jgi:hypothetical protein
MKFAVPLCTAEEVDDVDEVEEAEVATVVEELGAVELVDGAWLDERVEL